MRTYIYLFYVLQSYDVTGPITAPIYGVPVNNEQPPPGAPVNNYPTIYNPQEHQAPVQVGIDKKKFFFF